MYCLYKLVQFNVRSFFPISEHEVSQYKFFSHIGFLAKNSVSYVVYYAPPKGLLIKPDSACRARILLMGFLSAQKHSGIVKILDNYFGFAQGGQMNITWYDGGVRVFYESGSSGTGFLNRLMKYNNGDWVDVYNSHVDYDFDKNNLNGYMVNEEYVSEEEFDKVREDVISHHVNLEDLVNLPSLGNSVQNMKSEWAKEEIDAAIASGLVPEELQTNYTSRISRHGFCLLAAALIEVKTGQDIGDYASESGQEEVAFSDTNEPEIMSSARLGIVNGYEDGTFKPQADITREQAAAMLARCAKLLGMSDGSIRASFADAAQISAWAADSVAFVRSNEIMSGNENNNFMPQEGYTIEQAIATFYRMYNKLL